VATAASCGAAADRVRERRQPLLGARHRGASDKSRVRFAVGSSRWQIVLLVMIESLVLAAVGGALGCAESAPQSHSEGAVWRQSTPRPYSVSWFGGGRDASYCRARTMLLSNLQLLGARSARPH